MSSKQYTTEFVIKGDSTSGVKATRELQQANADMTREMQRAQRQSEAMTASFESVSAHAQRLATVSAATTAAMGAMAVSQTHNVAEQAALARSVGVTVQTLQQWEFAAQSVNLGAGKMGDIFKDTSEKIGDFVATGGGEAADLFERLNLDIDTLMGMRPDQQLLAIGEALDGVATQGEKIFFMESLANDASRLLPLLENNAAALRDQISLADQLGVALPQSDIDSIEQAAQKLNELTALGTAFANSVAAQWAPSFIAVSDGAQELTQWLGGMGEVVELVTDGAGLLSGVLAGRLVGALAASGAATVKKINADRAAAAQAAVVAQRERQVALETARRAEAEQVAAQNSARMAAQRAQAAELEAAGKLREIQATQQLMAAERALEAQRLQAQITATGRQQSLNRLAEIRRTEQGLVAQATTQQQALHAAQQQTLISAQALATAQERAGRAATATNAAYAASTAAANTAATAHTALAGAMRLGRAAMAPLGGPLGVATLAASAFFLFRDSSDEVNASLMDLDQPLEQTIESFREMTREAQQAALVEWGRQQEEEAEKARAALGDIRQEIAKLGGASIFGGRDETQYENYRRLLGEINKVEEGGRRLADVLEEAQGYMDIPPDMLDKLKLLARDFSNGTVNADELGDRIRVLTADMNATADAAENTGQAVNNGAPSATTLDAWAKYNDRLRESIAATRDGGSAMGAANRALDGMGDDVNNIMRGYSVFLSVQDEALKDQRKAQQEAAAEARRAAEEAERTAQRQAQAAQQSAEAQAKALAGVQQEMDPLLADHAEYVERLAVLDRALAEGTISEEAYGEAVRWSAEQYQRAATGAEEYEKQTAALVGKYDSHRQKAEQLTAAIAQINDLYRAGEIDGNQYTRMMGAVRDEMQQLALDADPAAQEMARAWEEASNRIDETFADAFAGAFDSFDDFTDQLLDGFKRLLAELAYQATLKPIVVEFTQQMGGALGIPGVGGQGGGGGGFNLNGISSLYNGAKKLPYVGDAISGIGSALGFGSSTAVGYSGALGAATSTGYGGALGSAVSGAAQAGGGLMGAASAAMPWLAGGLLVDNVLGLGITDGITKAISGLFGGGKTNPHLNIDTRANDSYGHGSVREGAFGAVGFAQGTRRSNDLFGGIPEEREFLAAIAASDDLLASLARSPQELQAMAEAVQGVRLSASNVEGVVSQLSRRTVAAVSAMDGEFGEFVASLGTDVDTIIARTQGAVAALDLLSGASGRLNLQFDASAAGALRAADSIAQMAGGVDQLASLQDSYYTAFFSDAERAADLQQDVAASLRDMGLALPSTHEGFRQLVEQQNRLTESGQRNYVQLLQLAGPFDQLQTLLEQTGNGVDVFADRLSQLNGEISTLENEVRNAYAAFEKQSFDQQLQLLGLLGDEQTALALQRERELQGIDPLLQETQRRIWAMEDEAAAQQAATQAGQEYARSLAQVNDQLSSTFNGISQWVDQQSATAGTPGMNLTEAGDQFARQLVLAQSGDRNALQSITQYAEQYLAAGEAMYASGGAFQRIQGDVLDALKDLPDQISAEEYLAQEIRDALQAVVISAMPTDERLAVELSRELTRLDANQLTAAQVRSALAPHATDAEISRLIREVDVNGDGIITQQELANLRLNGLASGIGSTLKPMFDSIDLDASGLIDWDEFYGAFQGLASDAELRRIFRQLDEDGSGTISRLEALNRSSEGTEGNTQSLEERARDQLEELGGLVAEMTRTTGQFVTLNSGIAGLTKTMASLGVAQAEVARIEKERAAAEKAERERIQRERDAALIDRYTSAADEYQALMRKANAADSNYATRQQNLSAAERAFQTAQNREGGNSGETVKVAQRFSSLQQAQAEINRRRAQGWNNSADTIETYWRLQAARQAAQNLVDPRPFLSAAEELERVMQSIQQTAKQTGVTLPKVNGSHATGLWSVPFDGYIAELHREEMVVPAKSANLLRELPDRGLPMPDVPLPQFPQLGNSDVVQVLNDLRNENKQLRQDLNRLLGDVKANTANTANAVASSANRAEQQRAAQLDEQRAATSAARVKGRTV